MSESISKYYNYVQSIKMAPTWQKKDQTVNNDGLCIQQ